MFSKDRFYTVKGHRVPSVTTILSVINKPFLVPWALNCAESAFESGLKLIDHDNRSDESMMELFRASKQANRIVSNEAKNIGSESHESFEAVTNGEDVFTIHKETSSTVKAFRQFFADYKPETIQNEVFVSTKLYAGTADWIGIINDKVTLIDFKTSKRIFDEYKYQVAAYRNAWNFARKNTPKVERSGVLRLDKKTGKYEYKDFSNSYIDDLEAFINLTKFWYSFKGYSHELR